MTENHHAESVKRLFDAKADSWSAKYKSTARRGAPPALAWRIDVFTWAIADRCPAPARVLDFGCGTGELAQAFAERGYEVTACDVSEPMVAQARAAFGDAVRWVVVGAASTRLPFADGELDAVVASSVLEYVADPDAVLGEWARILRPSGAVVATVPDTRHPVRRVERVLARAVLPALAVLGGRANGANRGLSRLSPRVARYAEYLRLSKNRYSRGEWTAKAQAHGLLPFVPAAVAAEPPLELLGFTRR